MRRSWDGLSIRLGAGGDEEDFFERERLDLQVGRLQRLDEVPGLVQLAVDEDFEVAALAEGAACAGDVDIGCFSAERCRELSVAVPCGIGLHGQDGPAFFEDREFVDQTFEFGDEVSGDEDRASAGVGVLVGADDGADEFASDEGVEAGGGFIEDEEVGFGADCADEGDLDGLATGERGGFLGVIEVELSEEFRFLVVVPGFAEGGLIIEPVTDRHPGVEGDVVRDIGEAGFDCDLFGAGVMSEDADRSLIGAEEVEQAFDGGGFAGSVTAEEAVAASGGDREVEAMDGLQPAIAADEALDLDCGEGAHDRESFSLWWVR
ncbi:MAG: hypothetical protein RI897_3844 [Verrucomicrobiota bacterium]